MRMTEIGLIAVAILAWNVGSVSAQTSTTTKTPSATTTTSTAEKCWDAVTKQVRNETPSTTSGSTMMTGSTSSPPTGSTSTSSSTKPPEVAGLPDCK